MDDKFVIINNLPYGTHERQKVDIFIPENAVNKNGIILFIHGGGWSDGDKAFHHADCQHFCNLGYICASMNYRFVAETISVFNELDDVTAALETIKNKCAEHGLNIEKLILSGGSAGAHLALLYAYTRKDKAPVTPVAVCAYCPPVSCSKPDFLFGISDEFDDWKYGLLSNCCGVRLTKSDFLNESQQRALKSISPEEYVCASCVPTAVFCGKNDDLIPAEHILNFIGLLNNAGVKNDLLVYENSGHTLDQDTETAIQAKNIIKKYAVMYF